MKLQHNKILITGGSSGIGLALAKRFLALDNQVIITGRDPEKLQRAKAEHPQLITFSGDLSQPRDLQDLLLFMEQQHPDVNILINNAGIQYNYQFLEESTVLNKIDAEIQTNLSAPIKLIALLLPKLALNPHAAIVNVSSSLAFVPKQSAAVYSASKAALHIFTKALRLQLKNTGIKVFEVIPSLVETPMTEGRGSGKISPEQLVDEFMRAFERDVFEIKIEKAKILILLNRFFPALMEKMINK